MVETAIQNFSFFNAVTVQLVVPNDFAIKKWYDFENEKNENFPFPFWAKVWPSAIALSNFLVKEQHYINNKKVVEIAAGLGLPSLTAAQFATEVICSDYLQEPLHYVQQSIEINTVTNVSCNIINWNNLPTHINTDVLLLSDINYQPTTFSKLLNMIDYFLQKKSIIILSTPQRIMAKPFIDAVLPNCVEQKEVEINGIMISILVLQLSLST